MVKAKIFFVALLVVFSGARTLFEMDFKEPEMHMEKGDQDCNPELPTFEVYDYIISEEFPFEKIKQKYKTFILGIVDADCEG